MTAQRGCLLRFAGPGFSPFAPRVPTLVDTLVAETSRRKERGVSPESCSSDNESSAHIRSPRAEEFGSPKPPWKCTGETARDDRTSGACPASKTSNAPIRQPRTHVKTIFLQPGPSVTSKRGGGRRQRAWSRPCTALGRESCPADDSSHHPACIFSAIHTSAKDGCFAPVLVLLPVGKGPFSSCRV